MDSRHHIAVVDDHRDIRELVALYLTENGFRVSVAESVAGFEVLLQKERPDLVVLDIMMPGEDGLSLCRRLASRDTLPIIFLTAMASDVDRIVGLELGADDYLTKPFNPRELLARIKAVLRRSAGESSPREVVESTAIRFDRLTLDIAKREVVDAEGLSIPLSAAEFKLLCVFLQHPGAVLSRDQLLQQTAGRSGDAWDRSIDNQISRLRRKIEPDPKEPTLIRTQWGDGYLFTGKVEPA